MELSLQWGYVNEGSCLVPWFARSDTCPTCRRTVKGTHDDHNAASLTETILSHFPDQKRNPDELKELELIYKPGQKVFPTSLPLNSVILTSLQINITNTYSDEDDEPDPEEEEEEDNGITWPPCPCCVRPNPHNFACPDPIPPPDPVRGPVRVDVYSYRSHLRCQSCPNTFPTAWKPGWKCENCGILNCGNLFQCDLQGVLRPTADQVVNLNILGGLATTYFDGNALTLPNFINNVELALFHAWMTTNQVTWRDVGMKIYAFLRVKYDNMVPFTVKPLRPEDFACQPCTVQALRANFVSWWIHERESTGYVDNRTRCWYGRGCRTQVHNPDHARRLVHACDETPAVGRRAHAPPRDGGVAMGAGAPGDGVMGDGGFMGVAAAGGGGDESGGDGAADGDGAAGGGGDGGGGGGGGE